MSSDKKIIEGGGEGSSHDTPQAITITIMAPSALETTTIDSALVTSVEAQDARQSDSSLLVVPAEGEESISVTHGTKDLLQTVTETHMGNEDLPVISNINNAEVATEGSTITEESTIKLVTKKEKLDVPIVSDDGDDLVIHCLICNEEFDEGEQVPVFKSLTSTSHRKVSVFLGILVGQKLTSRKAHSNIICQKCFGLLNKLDLLEVQIRDTKEEIVTKYQDTVSKYGGRARRKKPTAVKKSEYVFPKLEPEDEDQQALSLEMDETFEPRVDDLMEEEHDRHEDQDSHDEEWEPEFKRTRVKRDLSNPDSSVPPKRKRGRPRKDASKSKGTGCFLQYKSKKPFPSEILPSDIKDTSQQHGCGPKDGTRSYSVAEIGEPSSSAVCDSRREETLTKIFSDKQCPVCERGFLAVSEMKQHFAIYHSDVDSVTCGYCQMDIACDIRLFIKHCKSCFPKDHQAKATKWCGVCHKELLKSEYVKHIMCHKVLPCPICNYSCDRNFLRKHMATHDHRAIKTYKCIDCSAVYKDASNLANHRKRNHLGQEARRHLCEVCGKKFVAPSELRIHVSTVHHNLRKFVCEFCGLRFKVASELSYHRRTHTGEKPHVCRECGGAFTKPNALAKHVRLVHRMEYQGKYKKRLQKCEANMKESNERLVGTKGGSSSFVEVVPISKESTTDDGNITSSEATDVFNVKVAPVYSLNGSKWINFPQL